VTRDLRPPLLDDLGLAAALRAVVSGFTERTGIPVAFDAPATLPAIGAEGELALFRALQEALSNVARHAAAKSIAVSIRQDGRALALTVQDDGRGLPDGITPATIERPGHMGITGMRERIGALGGTVTVDAPEGDGVRIRVAVPLAGAGLPTKE